jgi:hypothetical protein
MASVYLNFVPPNDVPDLTKLHIYEAPAQNGPFSEIEAVTAIGTPGRYITDYTTELAVTATDWFAIQWENSKGALSTMSSAIQGGTTSVVSEVVDRVLLRDPSLNEQIVAQEAAAVVESYYGTLTPDISTVTNNQLSGLTLLTMARCYVTRVASGVGTSQSWSAGLLSEKMGTTATTQSLKTIEDLIRMANVFLGRSYTVVALMKEVEVAGGFTSRLAGVDISRSLLDVETGPIPKPSPSMAIEEFLEEEGIWMEGEQIPAGGDTGDVLRRSGPDSLAWTKPPYVMYGFWNFSTSVVAADPGSGKFRYNNPDASLATQIFLSLTSQNNVDVTAFINSLQPGNAVVIQSKGDASREQRFVIQTITVGAYITLGVENREISGTPFTNNMPAVFIFVFDALTGAA